MSFQDIKPPKDAEGREIPLTTKFLYRLDGEKLRVEAFVYFSDWRGWKVVVIGVPAHLSTSDFLLLPPDSWEQLEHDATLAPRDYLQARGIEERKDGRIATMMLDLVSRAKALAEREKRND